MYNFAGESIRAQLFDHQTLRAES